MLTRLNTFLRRHLTESIALCIILLFSAFIRLHDLSALPQGLYYDEAFYGKHAAKLLAGNHFRIIYYNGNEGQPGLFVWLVALSMYLQGETIWALRSTVGIIGCLTVLAFHILALEMWRYHKQRHLLAQAASFMLAVSFWHLIFSRITFSVGLALLFEVLALWLTLLCLRKSSLYFSILAGAIVGLGFYSYWQFYTFAPLPLALILLQLRKHPSFWHKLACFCAAAVIVALPLVYAALHEDMFARVRKVFVLDALNVTPVHFHYYQVLLNHLLVNGASTIGMLFFVGDGNWRHNFNGQAELSGEAMAGLLVALGYGLYRWRHLIALQGIRAWNRLHHCFAPAPNRFEILRLRVERNNLLILLVWLLLAMLPAILAEGGIPHASRAVGMVAPVMMLAGYGTYAFLAKLHSYCRQAVSPVFANAILCVWITAFASLQCYNVVYDYFTLYVNAEPTIQAFGAASAWCSEYEFCK